METTTKISGRIRQFIEYKKLTINKFSESVGASNSYFNKLIKNNTTIGSDRIENILKIYPEINPAWLITGNGEMLLKYSQNEVEKNILNYSSKLDKKLNYNSLTEENRLLKDKILLLQETIDFLREKNNILKKTKA